MTTVWTYDFEAGVASGTAMTTANSNFKTLVQSGWTFNNTHLLSQGGGALAGRCAPVGATCIANDTGRPWVSANVIYYRFYAYMEKVPTATTTALALWCGPTPSTATTCATCRFTSSGAVQVQNNSSTAVATSPANITAGTYVRVEGKVDITNNQQQLKVFFNANIHGATPDYDSGLVTSSGGGVGITTFQFGATVATTAIIHYDNLAFSNSGWLGAVVVANQPPTANAGADQNGIEPWSTVTLTGTDSDSDGTIVTRTWTQTGGTPVTYTVVNGNTVTFTAPQTVNGDTGSHKYTVTDNGGASANDSVNITTLPVTERAVLNGVEVPARLFHVHSTTAINPPSAPQNVVATLTSSTSPYSVSLTWTAPTSNGGSPITGYTVTRRGGTGSHTLAATATSDTWINLLATPPYTFDVFAINAAGTSPAGTAGTSATAYRFPGDTLPLVTGKILLGCTEGDSDGTQVWNNFEFVAPEADTGKKYAAMKEFYHGSSVLSNFTPSTGAMALDIKSHWAKGHITLINVAIQQSGQTWRQAADGRNHTTWFNFIQWVEEGSDMPDVPVWLVMPHEAQQYPNKGKVDLNPANGMTPGDYADLQVAFRQAMDDYAISKVGGTDPTKYKWKHLAFGGLHTGEAFNISTSNPDYAAKGIDNYYVSYQTGLAIPKRTHDFVGPDQYQSPISGNTTIGRTGVPAWNNVSVAAATWCKNRGYPIIWGEFGVHNSDGDAGLQLQDFFNHITDGTYDIVAALYFNATQDTPVSNGPPVGVWLFTNNPFNDPTKGTNSNFKDVWYSLMADTQVVHFWDVGYARPPGV